MFSINVRELSVRQAVSSYIIKYGLMKSPTNKYCIETSDFRQEDGSNLVVTLDAGNHSFLYEKEAMSYNVSKGDLPITGKVQDRDATVLEEHYLVADNYSKMLELIKTSIEEKNPDVEKRFPVLAWNARSEVWRRDSSIQERSLDSVVLDPEVKEKLKRDLDVFTDIQTNQWYAKHCIPFKRGYLFYGKPGTGKTSTICAIASYLKRKVYRLNLVAPGLCDNSLMEAVNCIKKNSILVMEDIDSLFGKHREKNEVFSTTFSGLLNAIDGLGDYKGHLFIMTTNHPEKIDKALRRKGRIDLEIEFHSCNKNQAKELFLKFYPNQEEDAEVFSKEVVAESYTPADLQHHFIYHRKNSSSLAKNIDKKMLSFENCEWKHIYS